VAGLENGLLRKEEGESGSPLAKGSLERKKISAWGRPRKTVTQQKPPTGRILRQKRRPRERSYEGNPPLNGVKRKLGNRNTVQ